MLPEKAFQYTLAEYGDRFADPVQVRRDLLRVSAGRLWDWVAEARELAVAVEARRGAADDAGKAESGRLEVALADLEGRIVAAAYEAFGLPPFDQETGKGVLEAEARKVLVAYLSYAEGKG